MSWKEGWEILGLTESVCVIDISRAEEEQKVDRHHLQTTTSHDEAEADKWTYYPHLQALQTIIYHPLRVLRRSQVSRVLYRAGCGVGGWRFIKTWSPTFNFKLCLINSGERKPRNMVVAERIFGSLFRYYFQERPAIHSWTIPGHKSRESSGQYNKNILVPILCIKGEKTF